MEYPYQLVTFLKQEPKLDEAIYGGENGWYPQIALKRRFGPNGISEDDLLKKIEGYLATIKPFDVHIREAKRTERMPVEVIEIQQDPAIMNFHTGFIESMGDAIVSKYGDREGSNYYPHVTLEYWKKRLFDPAPFENTTIRVSNVWLVKDKEGSEESYAFRKFELSV